MDRDEFWAHVEAARHAGVEDKEKALRRELGSLSLDELGSFQSHFDELVDQAYDWTLWGAAYLYDGGCSDDGFTDFRYGLISLGRATYEEALTDPDSLVAVEEEISNELFGYVALDLHEKKGGGEMDRHPSWTREPRGERWDFDDEEENRRRLPRLSARFSG